MSAAARPRHRWPLLAGGLCAMAVVALSAAPVAVRAHSELVDSTPAAGAVLTNAPPSVSISFTGPVGAGSTIDVLDSQFKSVTAGPATVDPGQPLSMSAPLKPLAAGTYTVQWKTVDPTDGHTTDGSFVFQVAPKDDPVQSLAITLGMAAFIIGIFLFSVWRRHGTLRPPRPGEPMGGDQ